MEDQQYLEQSNVAEIEISYTQKIKPSQRPKINSPEDAYAILMKTWDKAKIELVEQFKIILLNRANHVLGICTLTTGTVTGTLVDPKQIFAVAIKANAVNIMLAHNHPSGSLKPSYSDQEITKKLKAAGELLEVKVIDHIIVTVEGYYSFATEGVL